MQSEIKNLTLFTDASYCPHTHAAGGAFWARGDCHKAKSSFPLLGVTSSTEAEIMATCHGILALTLHPPFKAQLQQGDSSRLIVVVDCTAVQLVLANGYRGMNSLVADAVQKVSDMRYAWQFLFKINHVHAHKGVDTSRRWVNDWCDKHAYEQMVRMRNGITGGLILPENNP